MTMHCNAMCSTWTTRIGDQILVLESTTMSVKKNQKPNLCHIFIIIIMHPPQGSRDRDDAPIGATRGTH